jgi:hypothetical protein
LSEPEWKANSVHKEREMKRDNGGAMNVKKHERENVRRKNIVDNNVAMKKIYGDKFSWPNTQLDPRDYQSHTPLRLISHLPQSQLPEAAVQTSTDPHHKRSSSPISTFLDDTQILAHFFEYKIARLSNEAQKEKWRRYKEVIKEQDWTIADMKAMEKGTGIVYKLAVDNGLSDGFARHFAAELRAYKPEHRRAEAEAQLLAPMTD